MNPLTEYARSLVASAGKQLASGEVFAKVLTTNDDSGRHGVLIPNDAYSFFPHLELKDPRKNQTLEFAAFDSVSAIQTILAYKYYERYPERRITRLHRLLNESNSSPRLLVCLRATHCDGSSAYYVDCTNAAASERFSQLFNLIFGHHVTPNAGIFVVRSIETSAFSADEPLQELLARFDEVKGRGWIDTLRAGDTGIGYTFETLVGVKENNDQIADFKGIELKCKGLKEGEVLGTGKINLFQAGPTWLSRSSARERIRILGRQGDEGLYSCYSQLTTKPNNLGLLLRILDSDRQVRLHKNADSLGYWDFDLLARRLAEKHSRAAFIKARRRTTADKVQYSYEELIYCESPSIERFNRMLAEHRIVFEFLMSEKASGVVRNHGYPWRLIRSEFLDQLFAFQIKLR